MKITTVATAGLVGVALLGAGVAAPAQAAATTSISIHVQTTKKTALKDIAVSAEKGTSWVFLGVTDDKGNLTRASGSEGTLSSGKWTFYLQDSSAARQEAKKPFATSTFTSTLKAGKNRPLGTKVLLPGSRILGTVTAPSGRPVQNAQVLASKTAKLSGQVGAAMTSAAGAFDLVALPKGTISLFLYAGGEKPTNKARVKVTKAGAKIRNVAIKNYKVTCDAGFSASPGESIGEVDYSVSSTAEFYGLTNPGGSVTILRDGTAVKTIPWTDIASSSGTLTDEPTDGPHAYTARYTGGDCVSWTSEATSLTPTPPSL